MRRTVVIVDDHPVVRASVRRLLEREGYDVVAEATSCAEAVAAVTSLRPDVVILDVVLPDGSGLDVANHLASTKTRIVLISSRERSDLGARLDRLGVAGFISKAELSPERLEAVLQQTT